MRILSRKVRGCASFIVLNSLLAGCVVELPVAPKNRQVKLASINLIEFVHRTNDVREQAGLPPLEWNEPLTRAATLHARQMANLGVMAHEIPQAEHPTLSSRASSVGYEFARLVENIAFGYPSVERVMAGWLSSAPHRENILNPEVVHIGVGVAINEDGTPYYANLYGRTP